MALLELRDCTIRFGGLTAVASFSMKLPANGLYGLIGPNGAGKTTIFNMITGVYRPTEGEVLLAGQSLVGMKPYQICSLGVARTFQNIRLCRSLSVLETVQMSLVKGLSYGFASAAMNFGAFAKEEARVHDFIIETLSLFELDQYANDPATSLPYGDQRRLEIVRALASNPRLLLLDEPAAGTNPSEKRELLNLIRQVKERFEVAILLIEHDMSVVMGICEQIVVLHYGAKIVEGTAEEIRRNPKVIEAYLGEEV